MSKVFVLTKKCISCREEKSFTLETEKYRRWQRGEHIQNVFPELSVDDRELLISGICGKCFDLLIEEADDE